MDNLTKKDQRDRSKINMHEAYEVKYWTRELGVSREDLQKVVDKVGNSAATVRKELGFMGERAQRSRPCRMVHAGIASYQGQAAASAGRTKSRWRRSSDVALDRDRTSTGSALMGVANGDQPR